MMLLRLQSHAFGGFFAEKEEPSQLKAKLCEGAKQLTT
ncbi:hypothetical protein ACPOL_1448 [Acidisarcina polymorpha]|uniref:Uncharacterized protein n=1 Tax=Acidisarcina polymorpha TaxID=2211140 RepID=A0A2Z5FWB4_9BACT|nr:hypothetical protein ACPOL_1448 [Acidisarcina polymorpha]